MFSVAASEQGTGRQLNSGLAVEKSELTPDFEGLVVGTRNDPLAVGREVHGGDFIAVSDALLRHELQRGCKEERGAR